MKSITESLKKIIADYGLEILDQRKRLNAILHDLYSSERRLRFLLDLSLLANIPQKIADLQNDKLSDREAQLTSLKHYFKEQYFLEDVAVKLVFDCWEHIFPGRVLPEISTLKAAKSKIPKIDFKFTKDEELMFTALTDWRSYKPITKIKDETKITDIDGNVYQIIKIGNQKWMVENLKTTRYRNGDLIGTTIPATKDIKFKYMESSPKYQWPYDGNERNASKYGRLYTGYAVLDRRNIAPRGYRVPTYYDWKELENFLIVNGFNYDGSTVENKIAKSLAARTDWEPNLRFGTIGNNLNQNNKIGFTALPGGQRNSYGEFSGIGSFGGWWSSTKYNMCEYDLWYCFMCWDANKLVKSRLDKSFGGSVRCVSTNRYEDFF